MKTDELSQQQAETLAKYLSGEMSEEEVLSFEEEAVVTKEDKINIEKMKNQWSAMKGYTEPKVPDTGKAWNKLQTRLQNEKLIPPVVPVRSRMVPDILKVAAVLVILFGIGTVIYTSLNRNSKAEMVRLNTTNEANTLIKTLNDGSVIYIAQNSSFSFPREFENKSRNVELKGEAFFDIASNPDKPFIIETDEALIEVLGTAFNVKTQNGKSFELCVDRGKVKVTLKKDPTHSALVIAGEKVTTFENSLIKTKHGVNPANAWYRQRMHFKDESLENIISVLNRNFNTTFAVAEKKTGNRKLTVTFNHETVPTMTELICVALNLKSQNVNGSVVLSENKENATQN